jgi:NAD+ synthase (glutamine-hydrolysing)
MKNIKVATISLNQTPLDWNRNKQNIITSILKAKENNSQIILLPELAITAYGCEDQFLSPELQNRAFNILLELVPLSKSCVIGVGLPVSHKNSVFNALAILVDGKIIGFIAKHHLAGDGIHYEPRWFKAWPEKVIDKLEVNEESYPIGDLIFDIGGVRIGAEICEDAWVATRPGGELARRGVDIILNPSASHFAFDKIEIRKRFVLEGSRAFNVSYLYANMLGNEAGRVIYEGGNLVATAGELIAEGERFSYKNFVLTTTTINIEKTRMLQAKTASFSPLIGELKELEIDCKFKWGVSDINKEKPSLINTETETKNKFEEFTEAVSLALFDYLRKSWSNGFVVSLSGGADSTTVVVLVHTMVKLALRDLGLDGLKEKLFHIKSIQNAENEKDIIKNILVTLYQGTRNSGDVTLNAAKKVAGAVNAKFYNFYIDDIVNLYTNSVSKEINRELNWKEDDITLQNIQARTRSPLAWMFANLNNMLLVSTSNRSEAAVGYATMDGDTSGGISPIAGIDKAFIRSWLVWMEKTGMEGIEPIPELSCVNVQAPTAELRPKENKQTDEDDLMPYDLLDFIEKLAIRDKNEPLDIFKVLVDKFTQYSYKQLYIWVERFFKLWSRNQWKRERYAPSFHLDDENLDPKTWCRFPILSGGFKEELNELKEYYNNMNS